MIAVVEISKQQFVVTPGAVVSVPKLSAEPGEAVTFPTVLLTSVDGSVAIGTSQSVGSVTAEVLEHSRAAKVIVFKKKRRKGYQKLNGHRQHFTKIKVTGINA